MEEELNIALTKAREADQAFQVEATPLDDWLDKFRIDVWATKPAKPKDGEGEVAGGFYYPPEQSLRDPQKVKEWANNLHRDVVTRIVQEPGIQTHQLRAMFSVEEAHLDILKYYPFMFEMIVQNPLDPPFYMKMVNKMCDLRSRIRQGADVDHVEAELQTYFMKMKHEDSKKK